MDQFECEAVVIGAGVVGLAVARALALAGHDTMILERHARIGSETSARNSEVIHAGLYYPQGSLKAQLCVRGKRLLYDFAASHHVPHKRIGKWLVATAPEQAVRLEAIIASARANGVDDLSLVPDAVVRAEEPALRFTQVVQSPSTGILDSHAYMLALQGDAEAHGAQLVRDAEVEGIAAAGGGFQVSLRNGAERMTLKTRRIVNSAGLWAQKVAGAIDGLKPHFVPPLFLAKGSYAAISGKTPFRRLIYPMPEAGGLGVHLSLDMAGQGRLGRDVEWLDDDDPANIDYAVKPDVTARFAARVRSWWPEVSEDRLQPAYSGVRPKLDSPSAFRSAGAATGISPADASHAGETGLNTLTDFRIDGPALHGLPGLVNLFGIESPGLTSSLAIAERVAQMLA